MANQVPASTTPQLAPGGVMITEYTICALPVDNINYRHYAITVEYRGPGSWAVCHEGFCFGTDGDWEYEPQPSSRDSNWLAAHRFDEATAIRAAEQQAPLMTCNGITVQQALGRSARRSEIA
jgi:hypothetical protein